MVTWPAEIEKWKDFQSLSYTIVHGKDKAYNLGLPTDIHLINPEGLAWLITQKRMQEYDVLVIDESSKFKNSQTQRFKALKPFLPGFKRRWILTGTPAPNGLEDLFGQVYILDLGRSLGRYITHFRREFFYLAGYNLYDWMPKPDSWQVVIERISPLVLQMSAEEYLEMPELVSITIPVSLPKSLRQLYSELEQNFITSDEQIVAANAAVAGGKLRQVANGAIYDENGDWRELHDEKLQALDSLLEELGSKTVLILYEFNHDRERILRKFPEMEVMGGGLSQSKLADMVERFNDGKLTRLLGHPASMGHGLNLQGFCHHVICFGITWNLEYYDQAIARVYRQGQKSKTVFVYHIVAVSTKDEEVMEVLSEKDRTQQGLLQRLSRHRRLNYAED